MGCDIHLYTEVRVDGRWHKAQDAKLKCGLCNGTGKYSERALPEYRGKTCGRCNGDGSYPSHEYWDGRNYDLFAMLANVRNGRGFAGIQTGLGFNPICEPRGLPDDVTKAVKKESDRWGVDGHSHTWLTLADLEAYDWEQKTAKVGVIEAKQYDEWKERRGSPGSWCGDVWGQNQVTMLEQDYIAAQRAKALEKNKTYNVRVQWDTSYRDAAGSQWWNETLPALRVLAEKHGGPDNVRLVFWFDN